MERPSSVNVSFSRQCGSAGLRLLSWLQPQQLPSTILDSQAQGSRALGRAGAVLSEMAGACETPYGGKNLPPTAAPIMQGCSPSKICIGLPGAAVAALSQHKG